MPGRIAAALPDVRPTIWGAVPRVWEKLKAAIEFAAATRTRRDEAPGPAVGSVGRGEEGRALLVADGPVPDDVAAEWAQADELVLSKLAGEARPGSGAVGGVGRGADPEGDAWRFFAGIGIPIAEVWGMSELSYVASVSHPRDVRLGTVGKLLPGLESKIADDGEFLVRGPLVMKGYRKEPERPQRQSIPTAGCTPATSSTWTTTAICGSSTARKS